MKTRLVIVFTLATAALSLLQGCQTNEATGRRQFALLSREEEIQLGTQAMPQLVQEYGGESKSSALRQYVSEIGMTLARETEGDNPDLPWEFTVLESDVINAFALPGGKVFVSRGLMDYFQNEAQLAAVLGHEVGHVTAQHTDERVSHAMVVGGIAEVAGTIAGQSQSAYAQIIPLVVGTGGQGYLLKFGRDQESEADALGVKYMVRAGYSPKGMQQLLEVLIDASGGSSSPEILSTHPNPARRLSEITDLINREYADTLSNPTYRLREDRWEQQAAPHLKRVSGMGTGADAVRLGILPPAGLWCSHCRDHDDD